MALEDWDDDSAFYQHPEIYPWTRGEHGKFYVTPQGEFAHWQTDDMGNPHHDEVAAEWNHQQQAKGEIAPSGAWWFTDAYRPTDYEQLGAQVAPQAQRAGLRPQMRGYMAKKSESCPVCNHPWGECVCPGGSDWGEDPATDTLRDEKPEYGSTSSTHPDWLEARVESA